MSEHGTNRIRAAFTCCELKRVNVKPQRFSLSHGAQPADISCTRLVKTTALLCVCHVVETSCWFSYPFDLFIMAPGTKLVL